MESLINAQSEQLVDKWPADGLERVERCPVCGSKDRHQIYSGLTDRAFRCAPGHWDMYQCEACRSAYLDPRPTRSTIGLAYSTYFTHTMSSREDFEKLSWSRRIRRILANGYRNKLFGTNQEPASPLGYVAAMFLPSLRKVVEAERRYIPRANPGMRLLDVGCGNGEFLVLARLAGWEVVGVDFDPKAVETARSQGLDVRDGGVDVLDPEEESFNGITLSHVIEHVHDPVTVLHQCHALLKPGGWIWLETPNIDALGHKRYGSDWRGLEPPRHLVLFTRDALFRALEQSGFKSVEDLPYRPLCSGTFAASEAIAIGEDSSNITDLSKDVRRAIKMAELKARKEPLLREFITVIAFKE